MKRLGLIMLFCLLAQLLSAQRITNITYCPKVQEFVNQAGPLLQREYYPVGDTKLSLQVVIMTDVSTGKKIGYVDYTTENKSMNDGKVLSVLLVGYGGMLSYYTSSMDYDELDDCIYCFEYAQNHLVNGPALNHNTELFYQTKLGGKVGVVYQFPDVNAYASRKWYLFFNADPYERKEFQRLVPVSDKKVTKMIDALLEAKRLIEEKTR